MPLPSLPPSFLLYYFWTPSCLSGSWGHLTNAPLMFYTWSHRQCPVLTKPLEGSHGPCACCPWIWRWECGPWCWLPGLTKLQTSKGQIERKKFVFLSEPPCVPLALTWSHACFKTSLSLCLQHLSVGWSQVHVVSLGNRCHLLGWDLGWTSVGIAKVCPTWVRVKSPSLISIFLLFSTENLFSQELPRMGWLVTLVWKYSKQFGQYHWIGPPLWRIADRRASYMLNTRSQMTLTLLPWFIPYQNVCCGTDMCFVSSCCVREVRLFHLVPTS